MSWGYVSGADVIADARLRANGLPSDLGILIVEGRDDQRIFHRYCVSPDLVVVAGNKPKLLEAYSYVSGTEAGRFVFIVDCDYDAPVPGALPRDMNVVITKHPAAETDLVDIGATAAMLPEYLTSGTDYEAAARAIVDRAVGLAEPIGRLRRCSRIHSLGLNFDGIDISRVRKQRATISMERATEVVLSRSSPSRPLTQPELEALASGGSGGLIACHGHDLVSALKCVLHKDYRVPNVELERLDAMLRLGVSTTMFESWSVVDRLRRWEAHSSRRVLA